jgi:cell division protein FtsL
MKRLAIIGGLVVAVLAVAVYRAKLGAEDTQGRIEDLKAQVSEEQQAIATLRADEAVLTRPERIGGIAQQQLGLAPANPNQYTAAEALKQKLGEERTRLPAPGQPPETIAPSPDAAPVPVKPQP